jgi:hypothetical protein
LDSIGKCNDVSGDVVSGNSCYRKLTILLVVLIGNWENAALLELDSP